MDLIDVRISDIKNIPTEMPARDISAVPLNLPPKGNADTRGLFSGSVAGGLENVKGSGKIAPTAKEVAGKDAEIVLKDMANDAGGKFGNRSVSEEIEQFNREYEGMPIEHKGGISEFAEAITSKGVSRTRQLISIHAPHAGRDLKVEA